MINAVGIYGKVFGDAFIPHIQLLFNTLKSFGWKIHVYEPFAVFLQSRIQIDPRPVPYNQHSDIDGQIDLLFAIGGDGTFLETIRIIRDSKIPVMGINTGRLGFLASTSKEEIVASLNDVKAGRFRLQSRSLIQLMTKDDLFGEDNFALNELTIHKKETASMITIHTYIEDLYLNSYWADGLIVSTPTGSTAYSLSCGGPIMVPGAADHVITPIAPHNLNVRPVVVPDSRTIRLNIESRGKNVLCSLDSRSVTIASSVELIVQKAPFQINVVQTEKQNFLHTIRTKMLWGIDRRN